MLSNNGLHGLRCPSPVYLVDQLTKLNLACYLNSNCPILTIAPSNVTPFHTWLRPKLCPPQHQMSLMPAWPKSNAMPPEGGAMPAWPRPTWHVPVRWTRWHTLSPELQHQQVLRLPFGSPTKHTIYTPVSLHNLQTPFYTTCATPLSTHIASPVQYIIA